MASFWSGNAWRRFPLHITESHAYLHFLTANRQKHITGTSQHKAPKQTRTGSHMSSPVHTHTMIVQMEGNQTEYSQHRLGLYQQPFNFSSIILLRLFWTMRAHSHPAQGVCSHSPPCWHRGPLSQLDGRGREQLPSPFLCWFCCCSSFLRSPWSQPSSGLPWELQEQLQGQCLLPMQVFLPPNQQQRNRSRSGGHTYTKNVNPFSQASPQNKHQPWLP